MRRGEVDVEEEEEEYCRVVKVVLFWGTSVVVVEEEEDDGRRVRAADGVVVTRSLRFVLSSSFPNVVRMKARDADVLIMVV